MRNAIAYLAELDAALASADRILIASDFDGTLCPISSAPSTSRIAPAMLEVLHQLAGCPRVSLAVISGRSLADLAGRVPVPAVLAGNHGLEVRGPGIEFEHPEARRLAPELAGAREVLCQAIARCRGVWIEDKGLTLTIHYRQATGCDQACALLAVRREMGRYGLTFGMRAGKKAIEIYPRVGWKKGSALAWIRERLELDREPCLSIGDDRTDESMFTANADGPNLCVGYNSRSAAGYYARDCQEVVAVLAHLAGTLRGREAAPRTRHASAQPVSA